MEGSKTSFSLQEVVLEASKTSFPIQKVVLEGSKTSFPLQKVVLEGSKTSFPLQEVVLEASKTIFRSGTPLLEASKAQSGSGASRKNVSSRLINNPENNMNYYEVKFTYESDLDPQVVNDILASELGGIDYESFLPDERGLTAYVPENKYDEARLAQTLAAFPLPVAHFAHQAQRVEDRDWNEEWEKHYFQPIHIGRECTVRASFHEPEEGFTYNILIDPKMAFGTGNHATTYLMLTYILGLDPRGKRALDMGCGTAVLAILARMKGADEVVAIDIDEWAYRNALENIRINHTPDIQVALGGAERVGEFGPFDLIFANINRNILTRDMALYAAATRPGAELYMSGFYVDDIPAIREACARAGLRHVDQKEKDRWAAVKAVKE